MMNQLPSDHTDIHGNSFYPELSKCWISQINPEAQTNTYHYSLKLQFW